MGSFTFTTHVGEGWAVVRTRGYLSRVAGEQLEQEIVRLLETGERRFAVNLKETETSSTASASRSSSGASPFPDCAFRNISVRDAIAK